MTITDRTQLIHYGGVELWLTRSNAMFVKLIFDNPVNMAIVLAVSIIVVIPWAAIADYLNWQ